MLGGGDPAQLLDLPVQVLDELKSFDEQLFSQSLVRRVIHDASNEASAGGRTRKVARESVRTTFLAVGSLEEWEERSRTAAIGTSVPRSRCGSGEFRI